ncbi:MAG: hypothetical protein NT023_07040, partial [Armatimonadetes bacterium]|nr:hypothetical protein [Armatimonadota bacterium]
MNKEVKPNTTAELDELLSMAEDYETKKTQVSDRIKGLRSQIYLMLLTVISTSLMTYDLSSRGVPA